MRSSDSPAAPKLPSIPARPSPRRSRPSRCRWPSPRSCTGTGRRGRAGTSGRRAARAAAAAGTPRPACRPCPQPRRGRRTRPGRPRTRRRMEDDHRRAEVADGGAEVVRRVSGRGAVREPVPERGRAAVGAGRVGHRGWLRRHGCEAVHLTAYGIRAGLVGRGRASQGPFLTSRKRKRRQS